MGTTTALTRHLNVVVDKTDDAFVIKVNNRTMKTPKNKVLQVPNESLALAIANERRSNKKMSNMHLTALAFTAIDNPFDETKEDMANALIEYLKFDTVRFRDTENEELLRLQSRHWDPLIGWFEHTFDCHLPIEYGDLSNVGTLPQTTSDKLSRHLQSHSGRWPLVGINFMTRNLKSFVLTSCLTERFLKVERAVEMARLETKFQTEKWSKVEWEHDIDEQTTNVRVAAGALFYHLSV